jgi:hypothetical protein
MSTTATHISIPREFLAALQREASHSVASAAGGVHAIGDRDDFDSDDFEASLGVLHKSIACRDALLAEQDVDSELLIPVVDSTLRSLDYAIDEHDRKDLDDLARLVDLTRRMTAWRDEVTV